VGVAALAVGASFGVHAVLSSANAAPAHVLGEKATRSPSGLRVALVASRTTARVGEPVRFVASWSDDDGQRLGWSTLTGDEGAAKYVKPTCSRLGRHPSSGHLDSVGGYARPGTYTAYVEITTGGCGAATETGRATVTITVTR
jgi:hypothetical protein